jgi:cell division protein FtsN
MARFSFGKRTQDEEIPPEPVEGEVDFSPQPEDSGDEDSRVRRPLILAGIGVALIGGLYLANMLFLSPAPPPPTPSGQAVPVPGVPAPKPPAPAKEVTSLPAPQATPTKPDAKSVPQVPPASIKPTAPTKATPESAPSARPEPPTKTAPPEVPPAKAALPAPKTEAKSLSRSSPAVGGYSIQVGAMANEQNAEALKQKLDALGFSTFIRKGSGFVSGHVVTAGEPTGKREAEELARRLNVDGFPSQLISMEGKYLPQVGTFVNLDEAIDLARELQKKNYRPKITSKPATKVLYQVRTGQFDTREAAIKRGEELKAKGFSVWVVPN